MEVRKDFYQRTVIGVIPNDWEVKLLSKLSDKIIVGIASSATHAYRNKGIVLFRNQNIKPNYLDDSDVLYIAPEYEELFKNKRLKAGDLLTARTGYPGTTCIIPPNYEGSQSFTTLITKTNKGLIDIEYLCFYINSEQGQSFFKKNQIGGGQKNVNAGTLKLMPIAVPSSKKEQQAIAEVLSDTDNLIQALEKQIAKKRLIKLGVMQELLTPKEGWIEKSIIEIAENNKQLFNDGDWIESEHITNNGIRLIQTGNIGIGKYLEKEDKKYIYEESFKKLKCKELEIGDLLICRLAEPAGRACVLPNLKESKIITSVDVTIFRPKATIANRYFLASLFSTNYWFSMVSENAGGTTHKRISRGSLGKLKIMLPSIEEQNRIADIFYDLDSGIEMLEGKVSKYKMIKQGLMQNLLTGKIRLISNETV